MNHSTLSPTSTACLFPASQAWLSLLSLLLSVLPQSLSKEVESTPAAEDDQELLKLMQSLSQEELVVVATKERKTRVRYRKKCLQVRRKV